MTTNPQKIAPKTTTRFNDELSIGDAENEFRRVVFCTSLELYIFNIYECWVATEMEHGNVQPC